MNQLKLYLNIINWYYWVNSKLRKFYTPKDVYEFYKYMAIRGSRCPECVIATKCVDCTCDVPELFMERKDCKNYKHDK